MTGTDSALGPGKTFVVDYPGGSSLVTAHTVAEAMEWMRREKDCPTGRLTAWHPTPEELYRCSAHGMETLRTT